MLKKLSSFYNRNFERFFRWWNKLNTVASPRPLVVLSSRSECLKGLCKTKQQKTPIDFKNRVEIFLEKVVIYQVKCFGNKVIILGGGHILSHIPPKESNILRSPKTNTV